MLASPPTRTRVLVVEDADPTRRPLSLVLSLGGFEVRAAPAGSSGLREALPWRPDVVLCDIGRPGPSGRELARSLRAELGRAALLIAVTGQASPEEVGEGLRAGFDAVVPKPSHPEALLPLLASWPTPRVRADGPARGGFAMHRADPLGVLVVEGDYDILSGLSALLTLEGAKALQAADAADAVRVLRRHAGEVDAALIAPSLRDADGVEACRTLKGVKPGLHCWLVTDTRTGAEALLPDGLEGLLVRPFTRDGFRSCLHAMRGGALHDATAPSPPGTGTG